MSNHLEKQLQAALQMEVPADARGRIRAEVMAGAEHTLAEQRFGRSSGRRRIRLLRTVAIAAAFALLLFASTVMAATSAQPDSRLYPLKQKTEEARVVLAYQGLDQAQVEVGHASRRLDEIEQMVRQGKPEYVPGLISNYDQRMSKAKYLINEAAARGEDTSEVDNMMAMTGARHDDILRGIILDGLPDPVAEAVRQALGISVTPESGGLGGGMPGGVDSGSGGMPASESDGGMYQPSPPTGMDSGNSGAGQNGMPVSGSDGGMYQPSPPTGMDSGNSGAGQAGQSSSSRGM
ncbi:MAG: hypothetical protein JJD96_02505 [Thermoleophilia bacterium]|nr:hypothetical protein [Thermoleophilia bacterium]